MSDAKKAMPLLGSSPHISSVYDTRKIMAVMIIALVPAAVAGVIHFGIQVLFTILVSVAAAELAEFLFRKITKQVPRNSDLSAAITGLLLALIVPPLTPYWMTALGAIFAIVVAKEFFGGLGANVFNPALVGRAFLLMSFPAVMTTWHVPAGAANFTVSTADVLTSATPMSMLQTGGVLSSLGGNYFEIVRAFLLGNHGGSIGETSIVAILAGFIFLLITRVIDWRTPVFMLASVSILSFFLGRDPLIAILGGGVFFGAVFMATDYATTPLNSKGKIIFGVGAGVIIVFIRQWGSYPEGVAYSILIMNALTPYLNRLLPKKFGYVKPAGAKGDGK
ncbi:MAG: RnfABCDGE type electron transport complex subunit D [Treponema sp.]|nr:RnfABCDGE type electron transport complex subunit D [Treponema sp.]